MPFGDWSVFEMRDLQKNACDSVQYFTNQNRDMDGYGVQYCPTSASSTGLGKS
jgi:hypothetical protein